MNESEIGFCACKWSDGALSALESESRSKSKRYVCERGQRNAQYAFLIWPFYFRDRFLFFLSHRCCSGIDYTIARSRRVGTANGCRERVIELVRNFYKKLIRAFHSPFALFSLFSFPSDAALRSPLVNAISVCADRVVHYLPLHYCFTTRSHRKEREKNP